MNKVNILFVDDETNVLSGLRRSLHGYRDRWNMTFALGGQEAIDKMRTLPFDVVISDMKMPVVDGVEVLQAAKKYAPEALRSVLSGQSDRSQTNRVLGSAHQFVSKPCDISSLESIVTKAHHWKSKLTEKNLKSVIGAIASLPSLPENYLRLTQLLDTETPSIEDVAEVVSRDIAMSAKVLQLVNSSFFGQPVRTVLALEATKLLGADLLAYLVDSAKLFRPIEDAENRQFSLAELTQHSLNVAQSARLITLLETNDPVQADEAFTSGMLHDIGMLALADTQAEFYEAAVSLANAQASSLWQAEMHVFGTSHAEIGSYLSALWGLPHVIVDAIACYRHPKSCSANKFSTITAVHVANVLHRRKADPQAALQGFPAEKQILCDSPYLQELGLTERVPIWCHAIANNTFSTCS